MVYELIILFFFQAEDGIRDLVRSRGLGDVYKRQTHSLRAKQKPVAMLVEAAWFVFAAVNLISSFSMNCLLYTSDAADERSSGDLGGRRIIKKKKKHRTAYDLCYML